MIKRKLSPSVFTLLSSFGVDRDVSNISFYLITDVRPKLVRHIELLINRELKTRGY